MSTSWLHTFTGNLTVTFPNETKSETLSPATVDANNNDEWKLGDHKLRDGYTYTVKFPVWPSQDAYDAIADLKNGAKTYDQPCTTGSEKY